MPQVQAVRAPTEGDERRCPEDPGEERPPPGGAGDDEGRGHRHQLEAAGVHERLVAAQLPEGHQQDTEPGQSGGVAPPPGHRKPEWDRAPASVRALPRAPNQGQGTAQEEAAGACVQPVVEPGRVVRHRRARIVAQHERQRHRQPRGRGQEGHRDGDAHTVPLPHEHEHQQEQRPHDVELLLDRQRPEVPEGRGAARHLEVALLGQQLVPVGDVERSGRSVSPGPGHQVSPADDQGGHDDQQQQVQGGEEAAGPADPEAPEAGAPGGAPLGPQERGDEVARDHEEGLDAEEAAAHEGDVGMPEQHGRDRHGPQPVESGELRDPASSGGRRGRGSGAGGHVHGTAGAVELRGALGRIRTCAHASGGRCSIP